MAIDGPVSETPRGGRNRDAFPRVALAVVVALLLINLPALQSELQFFGPERVIRADGSAPVPQDGGSNPAVDNAFRLAASHLPAGATCVISLDAWNGDYFRASYIMMPIQIWPYSTVLAKAKPSPAVLDAAVKARRATCLLLGRDLSPPSHMVQFTSGAYSLYVARLVASR